MHLKVKYEVEKKKSILARYQLSNFVGAKVDPPKVLPELKVGEV